MFRKPFGLLLSVFVFFFSFFLLFPSSANAQFSGELGSISGSVKWGTETADRTFVNIKGNITGFETTRDAFPGFSTGTILPPDTYTVKSFISAGGHVFEISSQTVFVGSGQAVVDVNFDASITTGFVKGNLKVNGSLSSGRVQFCSGVNCPSATRG